MAALKLKRSALQVNMTLLINVLPIFDYLIYMHMVAICSSFT